MWDWLTNLRTIFNALLRLENIMGQVADALAGVNEKLDKARTEILGKISELENQLANAGKLDEADQTAINNLKDAAQSLDDVVPDNVDEPAEPPAEPTA